jgi:protein subunit release factor B
MAKELLFSLTQKDFEWDFVRGSGKGGQKRNKTSNAVRCRHAASGALGYAEDSRSQSQNRQLAFVRMAESPEFKRWHKIEVARRTGTLMEIKEKIEKEIKNPKLTKTEVHDEQGRWVPADGDYRIEEDSDDNI